MLQKIEIVFHVGAPETVEGDDVHVKDDALHVWNRHYNTGHSYLADEHRGSYPLAGIRRWRIVEGL